MSLESTLVSLGKLTEWPVEKVLENAELRSEPDPGVMAWLLELAQLLETTVEQRGVVMYVSDLVRECGNDLEASKKAMGTPPYNVFTPMELLSLGMPQTAIELARDVLDPERVKVARRNPFFSSDMPRHAMPWRIHYGLAGQMGLVVAQRWEEHLARCEGCRDNATYLD
jgi:hypothetical protein